MSNEIIAGRGRTKVKYLIYQVSHNKPDLSGFKKISKFLQVLNRFITSSFLLRDTGMIELSLRTSPPSFLNFRT